MIAPGRPHLGSYGIRTKMFRGRIGNEAGKLPGRECALAPGAKKPCLRAHGSKLRSEASTRLPRLCAPIAVAALLLAGCSEGVPEATVATGGAEEPTTSKKEEPESDESQPDMTAGDASSDDKDGPSSKGSKPNDSKPKDSKNDTLPKGENSTAPEPSCEDGIKNGRETDVDCGGIDCEACVNGEQCRRNKDCKSGYCHEDGICRNKPARCDDGIKNGRESDVDCGGEDCDPCAVGKTCNLGRDCVSTFCKDGICSQGDCQSDKDCQNESYGPCQQGYCDKTVYKCRPRAKDEGQSCSSGKTCVEKESCQSGKCVGSPKDCSHLATACDRAFCNKENGKCEADSLVLWKENFDKIDSESNGWTATKSLSPTSWQMTRARSSKTCFFGQDPSFDHSKSTVNQLLGTSIGGCVLRNSTDWDCVQSPAVDLRRGDDSISLRFWRHLHTGDASITQHKIELRKADGSWQIVEQGYKRPVNDSRWTPVHFDLSAFRHANFGLRVCLRQVASSQSSSLAPAGWSLDDFSIAPKACVLEL